MAESKIVNLRELFIEELAEIVGGGPEDHVPEPVGVELGLCSHWMTTMACGEEGPPCPSGC